MNNDLIRIAIVINTSHSTFWDNLCNVIVYILYINREQKSFMYEEEIKSDIFNKLYLEFTEKEIKLAINKAINLKLITLWDGKIYIEENGLKKIHKDNENNLDIVIRDYKQVYNIDDYSVEIIKSLIMNYIYSYMNENIETIEALINGNIKIQDCCDKELAKYTNEERKIVNDFLDWPNIEKDNLIDKFLHFSIDYCRMTVKKDSRNFNDILKGKKFYLDTNIIFRLMGLNGEKRKKTTEDFIKKCLDVNIKLLYTNITKKETFEAIKFHVNRIKENRSKLRVNEKNLFKLMRASNGIDGINEKYYEWAVRNNSFGKYDEFIKYLQNEFYKCVNSFESDVYETSEKQNVLVNDMTSRLLEYKQNSTGEINAEYDIQNILHVERKRKLSGAENSWNIEHYLITADHSLVSWANNKYKINVPIVVLPSVWYSMILKITGRTNEGFKSFVEFIKMKYIQHDNDVLDCLITCIGNKTDNSVLQEMMIDDIVENNIINNNVKNVEYDDVLEIVDKAYDNAIEVTKKEGYDDGYLNGIEEGKSIGVISGVKEGRKNGISKGIELGEYKTKIEHKIEIINMEINKKVSSRIKRKKLLKYVLLVACIVISVIVCFIVHKNLNTNSTIITIIISLIVDVIINQYIAPIINKTDDCIKDEEKGLRKKELDEFHLELEKVNEQIIDLKEL